MLTRSKLWGIAVPTTLFSVASIVLNIIIATNIGSNQAVSGLKILLYVALVISLINLGVLAWFSTLFVNKLSDHALDSKPATWSLLAGGSAIAAFSFIVSGVALILLVTNHDDLPSLLLHTDPTTLIGIWFAAWGLAFLLQTLLLSLLYVWAKNVLRLQRASRLDMDFRSRGPSLSVVTRPNTQRTEQSFGSQELTLNSPPRTPVSRGESSIRKPSLTRGVSGISNPKLIRLSNRSSLDVVALPSADTRSIDSALDSWDTSSVHHEMRAVIQSSPPVTRAGLETIPGSRPESTAFDDCVLPEPQSPVLSSSPHAATSDTATFVWSSSPRQLKSSPPSSPVNFSRPTSRPTSSYNNKPLPQLLPEAFDTSVPEFIHPLFRPTSPRPPPIATTGTIVTASPMANSTITPRTLAKIRSHSPPPSEHWKAVPSFDKSETQTDDLSLPESPTLGSPSLGSPGPSIAEEADLPPILPGFVLSAGSRSSLVEYGKRKSGKQERRKSQGSIVTLTRMSQVLM